MVSDSVSPVPRPARILIPPQSDGPLHRTLNGPSAASRRAWEEKSARKWLRRPKISERSTPITCMFTSFPSALLYVLQYLHVVIKVSHCQTYNYTSFFQDRYDERLREPRLTLRPPSLATPYAPVQNWHHQPEKLIFECCAYEASVCIQLILLPIWCRFYPYIHQPFLSIILRCSTSAPCLLRSYEVQSPRRMPVPKCG